MRDIAHRSSSREAAPAFVIAALAVAALAAAWWLQARGYNPCELCLEERIPYDVGIPLALVVGLGAGRLPKRVTRAGYLLLGLIFAVGAVLGAYHAGVEWKLWAGPGACSGAVAMPARVDDFLHQLETVKVVRCDEPALLVLGLSLAAWNALLSAALAGLAGFGRARAA